MVSKEVKNRIQTVQYEALKSVNKDMIVLYWDISSKIVNNQKKHVYWKTMVEFHYHAKRIT